MGKPSKAKGCGATKAERATKRSATPAAMKKQRLKDMIVAIQNGGNKGHGGHGGVVDASNDLCSVSI